MNKDIIVDHIIERLKSNVKNLSTGNFKFWVIEDLLPINIAQEIAEAFPSDTLLRERNSLREYKKVGVAFEDYNPIMEDITYAFHDKRVVQAIEKITGFDRMVPDYELYAGGLSSMAKNSFLNPHLDNSHNNSKDMYRVLNLLYYISSDWKHEYGGNLILYPDGMNSKEIEITSKFNSLVLMETNDQSFHGVSKVSNENSRRCVSNYYFRSNSTVDHDYEHVTKFYKFNNDSNIKSVTLNLDRFLRQNLSAPIKKLVKYKNWHLRKND